MPSALLYRMIYKRVLHVWKTLAQIALLWVTSKFFPNHRLPLCLKSLSDNTGAEASSNKLFTMSRPLCFFIEKLCLLAAKTGMEN